MEGGRGREKKEEGGREEGGEDREKEQGREVGRRETLDNTYFQNYLTKKGKYTLSNEQGGNTYFKMEGAICNRCRTCYCLLKDSSFFSCGASTGVLSSSISVGGWDNHFCCSRGLPAQRS